VNSEFSGTIRRQLGTLPVGNGSALAETHSLNAYEASESLTANNIGHDDNHQPQIEHVVA
jgi:hypothetical protein